MALEIIYIIIMAVLAFFTLVLLPGPLLISIAALIYALQTGFEVFGGWVVFWFLVIGILATILDNIFASVGAKKFGATKAGVIGAFIGSFVLLVTTGVGVVFGPFIGAFVAETLVSKKTPNEAFKAAIGASIGLFTGIIAKFLVAVGLVVWFALIVL